MLLSIPDAALREVLASQVSLLQLWPDAARDIMMLLDALRYGMLSLADVLAIGLVVLIGPASRSSMLLRHGRAAVTATGSGPDGVQLVAPCGSLRQIIRLEIHDLEVDGRSVLAVSSLAVSR